MSNWAGIPILSYISVLSVFLPIVIALFRYPYLSREMRWLAIMVLCSGLTDIISIALGLQEITNLPLLIVYTMVEFGILGIMYVQALRRKSSRKIVKAAIPLFAVLAMLNAFLLQGMDNLNSYSLAVESIFFISLSIYFFYTMVQDLIIKRIELYPMFWVNVGVLFYFSGNLCLFAVSSYTMVHSPELHNKIWMIHSIMGIVLQVAFAIGLYLDNRIENNVYFDIQTTFSRIDQ